MPSDIFRPMNFMRPFHTLSARTARAALFAAAPLFICALFWLPLCASLAPAAVPAAPGPFSGAEADRHAAASEISGSPWPGAIDHVLQKPLPDGDAGNADILINYPSLGNNEIDSDIRQWVSGIAQAFEAHLDLDGLAGANLGGDLLGEDDLREKPRFELFGSYAISRPSEHSVSITFELWNYTGASHGNLDIITLNYSLLTGQRLDFVDLFEDPELALAAMSDYSREILAPRLGAARRTQMLMDGTAPLAENFASLTLTPEGLTINFQPYQVAPWDAGIQKVAMPLEKLLPAGPLLALWGK